MKGSQGAQLAPLPRLDTKWLKCDLSAAFKKEGLSRFWNELVKDKEAVLSREEETNKEPTNDNTTNENTGDKPQPKKEEEGGGSGSVPLTSQAIVDGWTWGDEPDDEQLRDAVRLLIEEQHDFAWQAAGSTPSAQRLQQRLAVFARYFVALSRRAPLANFGRYVRPRRPRLTRDSDRFYLSGTPEEVATRNLGRVGSRAMLSIMFSFLRKAWRTGEDSDLCSDLLQDLLSSLQVLPDASLYDSVSVSPVWLEAVDRGSQFLRKIVCSDKEEVSVPLADRRIGLSLLLELAVQRANLQNILAAVVILLQLSEKSTNKPHIIDAIPLVSFLQRLNQTNINISKYGIKQGADSDDELKPVSGSPTKSFLQYLTLPESEDSPVNLRHAAHIVMSHMDRLVEPFLPTDPVDQSKPVTQHLYGWGNIRWGKIGEVNSPEPCDWLAELGVIDIYCADKSVLMMTQSGKVYQVKVGVKEEQENHNPKPIVFPEKYVIARLACHVEGKHFMALTSSGEVFSWGNGESGRLGHGDTSSYNEPKLIVAFKGRRIVHIVCGDADSAAIDSNGQLFMWGKGSYGRLGHGTCEDYDVPTAVEAFRGKVIVDISCGCGDAHTVALQDNGTVYGWGDGDYGKLGRGGSDGSKVPKPVERLDGEDIVSIACGSQYSMALSAKGQIFTWGKGDGFRLGHGVEENCRYPKRVEGNLAKKRVTHMSAGAFHCFVVTEDGELYGWGKNGEGQLGDGTKNTKTTPTLVQSLLPIRMTKVAAGNSQTFAWSYTNTWRFGTKVPYVLDVHRTTFENLDIYLKRVCDGLDSQQDGRPPKQDQECLALAGLNLLHLQLHAAVQTGEDLSSLHLSPGEPLLDSIKMTVISLATTSGIVESVQAAAQACLNSGWLVLLPTAEERAKALSEMLPKEEALDPSQVPASRRFMIELLVNSLMADGGLEAALDAAVRSEISSKSNGVVSLAGDGVAAIPLMQLVEQLLANATMQSLMRLAAFEQELSSDSSLPLKKSGQSASLDLLIRFQRLLIGKLLMFDEAGQFLSDPGDVDSSVIGASHLLQKYGKLLYANIHQVLQKASYLAGQTLRHFAAATETLESGLVGIILPELVLCMLLVQSYSPLIALKSDMIPLLKDLLPSLDGFNTLGPGCKQADETDMAWLARSSEQNDPKTDANDVSLIRRDDLENHNKAGGFWVVIRGKVFDLHEFKTKAPCGKESLEKFASGGDATEEFDAANHSEEALEQLESLFVGLYVEPQSEIIVGDPSGVSMRLVDTERMLALLQGLRACQMTRSLPISQEEEAMSGWLSSNVLSGGMESHSFRQKLGSTQRESSWYEQMHNFVHSLASPDIASDLTASSFWKLVGQFCRQNNLSVPLQFPADHPIELAGRNLMACLLKHCDLVPMALSVVEADHCRLPSSLVEACRVVYRAKMKLIQDHQGSSRRYDDVCRPLMERCRFLLDEMGPAAVKVTLALNKKKVQGARSRWIMAMKKVPEKSTDLSRTVKTVVSRSGAPVSLLRQTSRGIGEEEVSLDSLKSTQVASRFKWLRERKTGAFPYTSLLNDLAGFCLKDDPIDLGQLQACLMRQVERSKLRVDGAEYFMDLLDTSSERLPSVRYAILCGWNGLVPLKFQQSLALSHYLNDVQLIPAREQLILEDAFQQVNQWAVGRLTTMVRDSNEILQRDRSRTIASLPSSRTLVLLINTLTSELGSAGLSHVVNSGVVGILQSVVKLTGPAIDVEGSGEIAFNQMNINADVATGESRPTATPSAGPGLVDAIHIGVRIVKGRDWKWGEQDGPAPGEGTVVQEVTDGWVRIQWDTGTMNSYRMGAGDKYDLQVSSGKKENEDTEVDKDRLRVEPEMSEPNGLMRNCAVCLLRSLSILVGSHSEHLQASSVRILCGLLQHLASAANTSGSSLVDRQQHLNWATLGFIRGIAVSDTIKTSLASKTWTELLLNVAAGRVKQSDMRLLSDLKQRIMALRLLRVVLPVWGLTDDGEDRIASQVPELFRLLGQVVIECAFGVFDHCMEPSEYSKNPNKRIPSVKTASHSSTVAEELVALIRRLHCVDAWRPHINDFVVNGLQSLAEAMVGNDGLKLSSKSPDQAILMAILAVIGGIDSLPRLGGNVEHDDLGVGIVTEINAFQHLTVHFTGQKMAKLCPLEQLRSLPGKSFQIQLLSSAEIAMTWAILLRVSAVQGVTKLLPNAFQSLAKPVKNAPEASLVGRSDLRLQHLFYGLTKASRVFFTRQDIFRQVLLQPVTSSKSLFEEVLHAATMPSPVKAIFGREEIEAAFLTNFQYLTASSSSSLVFQPIEAVQSSLPPVAASPTSLSSKPKPTRRGAEKPETKIPKVEESSQPAPLVSQIMDMGFNRRTIEYAMKCLGGAENPEPVVMWLLEHPNASPPQENQKEGAESDVDSDDLFCATDESESEEEEAMPMKYKLWADFHHIDDYARYVRDNIKVGMTVRCRDSYEEVVESDYGRVTKVDRDGLHDLNVQAGWRSKGGIYWLRYCQVELEGFPAKGRTDLFQDAQIRIGSRVRVKSSIPVPKFRWGGVTPGSVGVVKCFLPNGIDLKVNYSEQENWSGAIAEMEVVPPIHEGVTCGGCKSSPIQGFRYRCTVCPDFDLCRKCFHKPAFKDHSHSFMAMQDPEASPHSAGKPGSGSGRRKRPPYGATIRDWGKCVKTVMVSSRDNLGAKLTDGDPETYWQSGGNTGKHWILCEIRQDILIQELWMQVDPNDASYQPTMVTVMVGRTPSSLREHHTVHIAHDEVKVALLRNQIDEHRFVRINIKTCKDAGIDCKVHGLSIVGRVKANEDEMAASFPYLAIDQQAADDQSGSQTTKDTAKRKKKKKEEARSALNRVTVFVWGLNDKNQLGGLDGSKVKTPIKSPTLCPLSVVQVVGGSKCLLALTEDGKVYACGEGLNGRLGLGHSKNVPKPEQIEALSRYVVKKIAVHSGGRHCLAITADGKLFSWGEGDNGKLGHGDKQSLETPKLVEALKAKRIRDIACGSAHSAAVTSNGELFTWGLGDYGRLGHGDTETLLKPKKVEKLSGHRVVHVACGSRDAQTLALTDDGNVWSWGDGDFGKLGRGGSEGCNVPMTVDLLCGKMVILLECGAQFSLALTSDGVVYTWGKGDYHRLGHNSDSHIRSPRIVSGLKDIKIVHAAVGALHCLAVSDQGKVYSWGDNDHGQQGSGHAQVNKKPTVVSTLEGFKVARVACGSSHSMAWTQPAEAKPLQEHQSVPFTAPTDPIGTALILQLLQEAAGGAGAEPFSESATALKNRPSLTKIMLALPNHASRQQAMNYLLSALHIMYARDAVVASLATEGPALMTAKDGDGLDATENVLAVKTLASQDFGHKALDVDSVAVSLTAIGQDDFKGQLSDGDVRLILDLLKLAVCGRVGVNGKATLSDVLKRLGQTRSGVAGLLLELCVTELEDVAASTDVASSLASPVVQETPHPYPDNWEKSGSVRIPGAENLRIEFDRQCSTERRHDMLEIADGAGRHLATRSGREWSDWSVEIIVPGEEMRWRFTSDQSVNGWGWRFSVYPLMPAKAARSALPDRFIQSKPSVDLVSCLLDFRLESSPGVDILPRLASALASCGRMQSLEPTQRIWALRRLRKLVSSTPLFESLDMEILLQGEAKMVVTAENAGLVAAMGSLVHALPHILLKQYESEDALIRQSKQLMHTPFLRSLLSLAVDLNLDTLSCCRDRQKWSWFHSFATALRVAVAMTNRTPLPRDFLGEVRLKLQALMALSEKMDYRHEDHGLFKKEHDEQLMLWLQGRPSDWMLTGSGMSVLFGWGHNHRGQLGGIEGSKVKVPRALDLIAGLKPLQVACGEQSLFAVTHDGKVYASGYGAYGRLGLGRMDTVVSPQLVEGLQEVYVRKLAVHCGGKHCLALTADGEVYSWGEGEDGKLGHGDKKTLAQPRVIETLRGKEVSDVACGGSHSACILQNGDLYTWGKGRYGRLGHGDSEDQLKPKKVHALTGKKVVNVACGSGDAQTVALTEDELVYS
eukprot:m.252836 g.252836  ORF g.252836 m.252836 type:complete len:3992 (+) comp40356_c1_seq2:177-12152(+)